MGVRVTENFFNLKKVPASEEKNCREDAKKGFLSYPGAIPEKSSDFSQPNFLYGAEFVSDVRII